MRRSIRGLDADFFPAGDKKCLRSAGPECWFPAKPNEEVKTGGRRWALSVERCTFRRRERIVPRSRTAECLGLQRAKKFGGAIRSPAWLRFRSGSRSGNQAIAIPLQIIGNDNKKGLHLSSKWTKGRNAAATFVTPIRPLFPHLGTLTTFNGRKSLSKKRPMVAGSPCPVFSRARSGHTSCSRWRNKHQ